MAQFFEGTPAVLSEVAPPYVLRQGTESIASGAKVSTAILDPRVTPSSIIVCWGIGAANAGSSSFSAENIVANTSFQVGSGAAMSAAAKSVGWAILKY